jgi:hypothetical protein
MSIHDSLTGPESPVNDLTGLRPSPTRRAGDWLR